MNVAQYEREAIQIAVRRLGACAFTLKTVRDELIEPNDPELRADVLLAAEDLMSEVISLVIDLRVMTWPDNAPYPIDFEGNETN
jgi:hypothetical protein